MQAPLELIHASQKHQLASKASNGNSPTLQCCWVPQFGLERVHCSCSVRLCNRHWPREFGYTEMHCNRLETTFAPFVLGVFVCDVITLKRMFGEQPIKQNMHSEGVKTSNFCEKSISIAQSIRLENFLRIFSIIFIIVMNS